MPRIHIIGASGSGTSALGAALASSLCCPQVDADALFWLPTGMLLGAKVSTADWWLWNQLPVTLGNFIGGFLFTGLFLYWTYKPVAEISCLHITS